MVERTCDECAGAIAPHPQSGRPDPRARFCSRACKSRWHQSRKPATRLAVRRPCEFCGYGFNTSNASHRYCEPRCAMAARGLRMGLRVSCDRFSVILWSACSDCGSTWPSTFAQTTRCPDCRAAHRRAVKQMRNAFRRGAPADTGEVVLAREVFERDGWVCQLCGEPVLPFIRGLHPRQATLDHIVPVSHGGEHVASNLQLAHLGCNSAKRDRMVVPCHSEGASTSSLPAAPSGCAPVPSATPAGPAGSAVGTPTVLSAVA